MKIYFQIIIKIKFNNFVHKIKDKNKCKITLLYKIINKF